MHGTDIIARHLAIAPGADEVAALGGTFAEAGEETIAQVLSSAATYADTYLVPLNVAGDRKGCELRDGRVHTVPEHEAAWAAFVEDGWAALDAPVEMGGMGLPNALSVAVQELFDQACPAFGMMPVPQKSGSRLLQAFGDEETKGEWVTKLTTGEWGATICISEPDAGSDVARLRTRAEPDGIGDWRITGEKCWISFGDQQLTERIGHFVLARTGVGISLFLVPSWISGPEDRNPIVVRRLEEKLGLHLSPTCVMGFEGAKGYMLGVEGRGLQQLFTMIFNMRLATGVQGAGIAAAAYGCARGYAEERRQGGKGEQPVPIAEHADIQSMLLGMAARIETLRGLNFTVANLADLSRSAPDQADRDEAAALADWLLSIIKTEGGDAAFDLSSDAIQVLGGAGYTQEWPVEQCLRDARVLTIFEGTTGMQAQDLLFRRLLRNDGVSYKAFMARAREEAADTPELAGGLDNLERAVAALSDPDVSRRELEAAATPFLRLATLAAQGWIAARLAPLEGSDPVDRHLAAAGRYFLAGLEERMRHAAQRAMPGASNLEGFADLL
ncbi:MAG: acyl-CoA dehydrogenase family protein [Sphingomonadaceae bacterium]